jgi:hypothetical protein
MKMKTIISVIGIVVLLSVAQSVFAISEFESGFRHGTSDGKLDEANSNKQDYIEQPGNGMDHHTQQFNHGYVEGWCSITGPNHGKETDAAVFDCERTN